MNAPLKIHPDNLHTLSVEGRDLLFHVPSSGLFEMDALSLRIIEEFSARPDLAVEQIIAALNNSYSGEAVREAVRELQGLEILTDGSPPRAEHPEFQRSKHPLSTIVLNVNTGCNLSCTYCYKEDVTDPAAGARMDFETARRAVDLLIQESQGEAGVNVVFFGGEPLSNLPLIRQVVDYAGQAGHAHDKQVSFSLTTNATLLSDPVIEYLDAQRFGITVSLDGPREVHDRNRVTRGGQGSYKAVAARTRRLLARYRSRPVGARVTLAHGVTDVMGIWDHLYNELGFYEVGFAPVTSGALTTYNLTAEELRQVFTGMKTLGRHYYQEALAGRRCGFSNLHRLLLDLHEGSKKLLPCGAGAGMLAVDQEGGINLCHRFSGTAVPRFGTVEEGIDHPRLSAFLTEHMDRTGQECATCRIRNLCSGGCYHESYARYEDLGHPVHHYCELLRDWIDFGIEVYARLLQHDPDYFLHPGDTRRLVE